MSAPLYFFAGKTIADVLPNRQDFNTSLLAMYGLGYTLGSLPASGCSRSEIPEMNGPGDSSGLIVCPNTAGVPAKRTGHSPEFQEWHCVLNEPNLWIGLDKEHPPVPADLVRATILPGHPVTLADGQSYAIPVARSWMGGQVLPGEPTHATKLPTDILYDANDELVTALLPRYQNIWDRSAKWWDVFFSEAPEAKEMKFSEVLDDCLMLLGVNYRYGRREHAAMRLFNTDGSTWEQVLAAACDLPLMEANAKKNGGSTTG